MNKTIKSLIIFVLILVSYIIASNWKEDTQYISTNNIKYYVSVDGTEQSDFPSSGAYIITATCDGGSASWDYSNWSLIVSSATVGKCSVAFVSTTRTSLNSYLSSLYSSQGSTADLYSENGIRYEGSTPNNYVKFNNELWRIIGVFDSTTHGVTGASLVKIIRSEEIGGFVYNNTLQNYWKKTDGTSGSLNVLLNNYYYNQTDGTSYAGCKNHNNSLAATCDFSAFGINNNSRKLIENVTWYLGGSTAVSTPSNWYTYERGTTVYSGNATSTTGYIGLMYPSDYGYSVTAALCARTVSLASYNTAACSGKAWLNSGNQISTISVSSANNSSIVTFAQGYMSITTTAGNGYGIRPTLYLKSAAYYISGTGTIIDPYIIGI